MKIQTTLETDLERLWFIGTGAAMAAMSNFWMALVAGFAVVALRSWLRFNERGEV